SADDPLLGAVGDPRAELRTRRGTGAVLDRGGIDDGAEMVDVPALHFGGASSGDRRVADHQLERLAPAGRAAGLPFRLDRADPEAILSGIGPFVPEKGEGAFEKVEGGAALVDLGGELLARRHGKGKGLGPMERPFLVPEDHLDVTLADARHDAEVGSIHAGNVGLQARPFGKSEFFESFLDGMVALRKGVSRSNELIPQSGLADTPHAEVPTATTARIHRKSACCIEQPPRAFILAHARRSTSAREARENEAMNGRALPYSGSLQRGRLRAILTALGAAGSEAWLPGVRRWVCRVFEKNSCKRV